MTNEPSVYIILLNYNNYKDTIECFESLQNITYKNYRIVIVDNNSPNNSMHYLREYLNRNKYKYVYCDSKEMASSFTENNSFTTLIQSGYNGGFGYGNNIGIKYAIKNDTDYVLILNNDTVVNKNFLEPIVNFCENNNDIGIASGKICYYDKPDTIWFNGGTFNPWTSFVKHINFKEKDIGQLPPSKITFITGCMMLIPKNIIKKIGLFNEEYFMYVEDLEFCYRVMQKKNKLYVCDESLIKHKVNSKKYLSKYSAFYIGKNRIKFILENLTGFKKLTSLSYQIIYGSIWWLSKKRIDLFYIYLKSIIRSIYYSKTY